MIRSTHGEYEASKRASAAPVRKPRRWLLWLMLVWLAFIGVVMVWSGVFA